MSKKSRGPVTVLAIVCLVLAVLPAAGCGESDAGTIRLRALGEPAYFATIYPVSAEVQPSLTDTAAGKGLAGVAGIGAASLAPEARTLLDVNGFVLTPGGAGEIYQAYQDAGAPVFVTLDSLSRAVQVLYERTMAGLENGRLCQDLEGLTMAMLEVSGSYLRESGEKTRPAALAGLEYFGVAARLLDPGVELPPEAEDVVGREVRLIEAAAGEDESPLFGYVEDYGRYQPRGRHAAGDEAERYFQAVTWYERMAMRLRPEDGTGMREQGREETRQALLLIAGLNEARVGQEAALDVWERLFQVLKYLDRGTEDLSVYDYNSLMMEVYGSEFPLSRLESDTELDLFIDKALALPEPDIPLASAGDGTGSGAAGMSLLGRRTSPDDYILEWLSEPALDGRTMPRGLDVPAALGSDAALDLNLSIYGDAAVEGYETEVGLLEGELANPGKQAVATSFFWSRFYAGRPLLMVPGEGYPAFMRGSAWVDRSLYAFLGAWTDLRRQDAEPAEGGEAGAAPAPAEVTAVSIPGYVEPDPEALARLAMAVDMMRRGLSDRGLLPGPEGEKLAVLYDLLIGLKGVAEKELRGEPFTDEEAGMLAAFGNTLESLESPSGRMAGTDTSSLPVVDVVSVDPESGEALYEAAGCPVTYHVIVPYQGGRFYTRGAGYSYYEFRGFPEEGIGDSSWPLRLGSGQSPGNPPWTSSFLVP